VPLPSATPSRIELLREAGAIRIRIRTPRSVATALFLSVWLALWAVGERLVLGALISPGTALPAKGFLVLWVSAWTLAGGYVLAALLMNLAGVEELSVDGRTLRLRRSALGIGRTRSWEIATISHLRASEAPAEPVAGAPPQRRRTVGGALLFDCAGKTVKFGNGLPPGDVERILTELRGRLGHSLDR
jgi:hypothetical protein